MSRRLMRFVRGLCPYGMVANAKARQRLNSIGVSSAGNWFSARDFDDLAVQTGLTLMPASLVSVLDHVVDVGANIGEWSHALIRLVQPAKVLALEPSPEVFPQLQRRLSAFQCAALRQVVASDSVGEVDFHITTNSSNGSVLQPLASTGRFYAELSDPGWSVARTVRLPKDTIDHLVQDWDHVSLIKLDVQGYERFVLAGATATLPKTTALLIELNYVRQYDNDLPFDQMHKLITEQYGFHLLNLSTPFVRRGQAIFADALYVNPQRFPVP